MCESLVTRSRLRARHRNGELASCATTTTSWGGCFHYFLLEEGRGGLLVNTAVGHVRTASLSIIIIIRMR